jgi:PAS domain S-box-containing protein
MTEGLRKSGIGAVGDIPWGTHFCHFYENKEDLLDVLVPYFKMGLEQGEFCVWSVFDPLDEQQARAALEIALPGALARIAVGDIEIVPQSHLYRGDCAADHQHRVRDWQEKLDQALARGYAGMRVNGNAAWLAGRDPRNPDAYENEFSAFMAKRRMILLCGYPQAVSHNGEVLAAGYTHRLAIARGPGDWQMVEIPELSQARENVKRLNAELERRAIEQSAELAAADRRGRQEAVARQRAEQELQVCRERSLCYFALGLVGMAIVSPTEGCIEVNDRLCDMLGYQRRELMEMTWPALVHPDDLAVDVRNYGRILAGEVDGYQAEKRWIRKNGDVVRTNSSLKCQRREDGSVAFFAAMVEEVTGLGPSPAGGPAGDWKVRPSTQTLSGREFEVARLIGVGRTVKEIAAGLELSEKTVSTYRSRILTKLNLKTTAELIRYALQNRIAD